MSATMIRVPIGKVGELFPLMYVYSLRPSTSEWNNILRIGWLSILDSLHAAIAWGPSPCPVVPDTNQSTMLGAESRHQRFAKTLR